MKKQNGFTVVELMVTIAILGLMVSIAIPSFSEWTVRMRVDNEISSLHRLILTARNTAVNMELPVTMCPLEKNVCTNNWSGEISVFINVNNNNQFDAGTDTIIKVKEATSAGDKLTYAFDRLNYRPTGKASNFATFNYCPNKHADKNRGIAVSLFGRVYASKDTNKDGFDEFRNGAKPSC